MKAAIAQGSDHRLGIALRDLPPGAITEVAVAAEGAGFTDLLLPETGQLPRDPVDGRDPFLTALLALQATASLRAGPGIAGTVFRSARHMAVAAATVNEIGGGRFLLGCGVSHRTLAEPLGCGWPASPLDHAKTYCSELRGLSRGGLAFGGGFPVLLAARGPKMVRVAARHADGVVLTWLSVSEAGRVAARAAADSDTDGCGAYLLVRVGPRDSLEQDAQVYGGSLPGYREHFARQGMTSVADVVDEACVNFSDPTAVAEGLNRYRRAGVAVPCLYPSGLAVEEVLELLANWPRETVVS